MLRDLSQRDVHAPHREIGGVVKVIALLMALLVLVPVFMPTPAEAAHPTYTRTGGSTGGPGSETTSHTINLPSCSAGNVYLVFWAANCTGCTATLIDDWTTVYSRSTPTPTIFVFARVATGSEGSTTTLTTNASVKSAHTTYCYAGWWGTIATGITFSGPTSQDDTANPDPPLLAHGWGAGLDVAWIAVFMRGDLTEVGSITSYPTDYTDGRLDKSTGSGADASIATATRNRNVESEDPGAFTISEADFGQVTMTFAIRPAAGTNCAGARQALTGVGC